MINCPNCNHEFKTGEFEKLFLEVLQKVEKDMADNGNASLGNCEYIYLKDVMGTIEEAIRISESEQ